jgi:hypothetical protein
MTAVSSGHRVEIENEPEIGVLLVNELALPGKFLIGVHDLIRSDGIGNALNRNVPALLACEWPITLLLQVSL